MSEEKLIEDRLPLFNTKTRKLHALVCFLPLYLLKKHVLEKFLGFSAWILQGSALDLFTFQMEPSKVL